MSFIFDNPFLVLGLVISFVGIVLLLVGFIHSGGILFDDKSYLVYGGSGLILIGVITLSIVFEDNVSKVKELIDENKATEESDITIKENTSDEDKAYSLTSNKLGVEKDKIILHKHDAMGDHVYNAVTEKGDFVLEFNEDYTEIEKVINTGKGEN